MDREALVLYLQNVRDLEVAKRRITEACRALESSYERSRQAALLAPQLLPHKARPKKTAIYGSAGACLLCFVFAAALLFTVFLPRPGLRGLTAPPFFALTLLAVLCFMRLCVSVSSYRASVSAWKAYEKTVDPANEQEQKRIEAIRQQQLKAEEDWQRYAPYYRQQSEQVSALLKDFYGMNVIACEYRYHLAAVQYLYEAVSTTQLTYEQILFETRIEDGIRRIESKLDQMIRQLEDVVYETRCIREENRQSLQAVIRQNEGMLAHLQSVETNSRLTAQYAQLSANYSKANAYFSLANYLKD